ncbi:si:ch211-15b10.6 [Clupea harengus]|uniref:TRAF-interacting protein with FHA domain-containing protein A n=1 Tax=Clupea harengus TaxID=7950 RepID=A0A6P3W0A8_CLUHA|nr:si:ch211-15b10.6 [Clupea harengus]XP_031440675.1 si:ch211-15b10.6 [Clupea harengus]XP_031440676.1 si:ch211-15b10.6 [Clupea harengus]
MMAVSQTDETDELLTCLRVQLYHPEARSVFDSLPMNLRHKQEAEDPMRLGRAAEACPFILNDTRVSRKQLALQAFRAPGSTEMRFNVQNLSRKAPVQVNGIELGHLVGAELPDKALIRFGRYELLVLREPGDSETHFEVLFECRSVPPSQEMGLGVPSSVAVMDSGDATLSWRDPSNEPSESDENL